MNVLYEQNPDVAYWINLAVTVLLPLVVALITKATANPTVKALVLLFLAAVTSVLTNLLAVQGSENVGPMIVDTVVTFIVAVAAYFGIWRTDPAGVTSSLQAVGTTQSDHRRAA
jgi:lipopolysaccharide export LptBFGC system permease protein LptF